MSLKPGSHPGDLDLPFTTTNRTTILSGSLLADSNLGEGGQSIGSPGDLVADPNLGEWKQSIGSSALHICFEDKRARIDIKKLFEFLEKNDLLVKE